LWISQLCLALRTIYLAITHCLVLSLNCITIGDSSIAYLTSVDRIVASVAYDAVLSNWSSFDNWHGGFLRVEGVTDHIGRLRLLSVDIDVSSLLLRNRHIVERLGLRSAVEAGGGIVVDVDIVAVDTIVIVIIIGVNIVVWLE